MPSRKLGPLDPAAPELSAGLAALRAELQVPSEFEPAVLAEARSAAQAVTLPDLDRTDLELITIDPPGSRDLDQAVAIAADGDSAGGGFTVFYAIADVAAFVTAGGAIDAEARRRVLTLYAPDGRTPLHPPELSEGAASLLADQVRPALLWTIRLEADGAQRSATVERARVRSREQLTYEAAQVEIDSGRARPTLALLKTVGELRERQEELRGGVSLPIPEQLVDVGPDGWSLAFRSPLPVEGWNAQISLLTGMAAASIMIEAGVGLLRTLPAAEDGSLRRLRRIAEALELKWPTELDYPDFVRSLDATEPRHAAMLAACTSLFRGAGYLAFSDGPPAPEAASHAALATTYAHTTAPLRRLADRFVGELCCAVGAGQPVPDWVRQALPELPAIMQAADQRAKRYERGIVDLVELAVIRTRADQTFTGVITELDRPRHRVGRPGRGSDQRADGDPPAEDPRDDARAEADPAEADPAEADPAEADPAEADRGEIMINEPAIAADVRGTGLTLGAEHEVVVDRAALAAGTLTFRPAPHVP